MKHCLATVEGKFSISQQLRGVRFQMGFPVLDKRAEIKMADL